jgi:hypothetical protein
MALYTFSKNSWHVKFFTWIFNENPTLFYKTMCPYFWTYVFIFIFLPLVLFVRMFGKVGTKILNESKDYKKNKEDKSRVIFLKLCDNPKMTQLEAYDIRHSKCYGKHSWDLPYDMRRRISDLSDLEEDRRYRIKETKRDEGGLLKKQYKEVNLKLEVYKENKIFVYCSYIVVAVLGLTILYVIYSLLAMVSLEFWKTFGIAMLAISGSCLIWVGIYWFGGNIIKPMIEWLSCRKLGPCGFCNRVKHFFRYFVYLKYLIYPFIWLVIGIGKLFMIIGHMIYSTYKKRCPLIEWKD